MTDAEAATRTLRVNNQLTIRFQVSGEGPPLVLMHTIRTQIEYFRELTPRLARAFKVYAIDLPGHGYSSGAANAKFDEPYFRDSVVRFIEALDLRQVTLVGESIGGALALTVAAALPDRVARIYAINPYDYETRYGDGIRRGNALSNVVIGSLQIPVLGAVVAAMENKVVLGKIMGGGYHDPRKLPEDLLAEFDKVAHQPGYRRAARKVLAGWRSWGEARDQYRGITAPVTLIYGDKDWSRAAERTRTASLIPNARVITLKNSGHFASLESASEVAAQILADH